MYWDQISISCEQRISIWLTVDDPSPPLCQRLPKATKRVDNLWYMNQEVTRGYVVFHILHKCFHITKNNTISSWVFFTFQILIILYWKKKQFTNLPRFKLWNTYNQSSPFGKPLAIQDWKSFFTTSALKFKPSPIWEYNIFNITLNWIWLPKVNNIIILLSKIFFK